MTMEYIHLNIKYFINHEFKNCTTQKFLIRIQEYLITLKLP